MKSTVRVLVAVVIGALVLAACGEERRSSSRPDRPPRTVAPTSSPSSAPPTSVSAPSVISVPPTPPPGPPTTPPPPITVPLTVTSATDAPAPPSTDDPPPTSAAPVTTDPPTSTTRPRKPTRRGVVFTPDGAPRRKGTIVVPKGDHLDTMVVLVHGGDGTTGNRNDVRGWQDFYAANGIPSLSIDYTLVKPGLAPPVFPKPQRDVKIAIQWGRENAPFLQIDPGRIVVQGFGAGAALGAQAYVHPDDPSYAGPGLQPGISDAPAAFVGFAGRYDGAQADPDQYYGGPPDDPDPEVQARHEQANSILGAAGASGPALLFQAAGGSPELVEQAQAFGDALASAEVVLVDGATDDEFDRSGRDLTPAGEVVAGRIVDWLTANFPTGE